jgi:hypothetical protein
MKCVNISQQLFIKIDSGIIYNYSTFTELLVNLFSTGMGIFIFVESRNRLIVLVNILFMKYMKKCQLEFVLNK